MTKHRTLRDALIGETVTVGQLAGEGPVRRRILDMGVTKGTQIFIRKVAPLGDPIEVTVRGYELDVYKRQSQKYAVQRRINCHAMVFSLLRPYAGRLKKRLFPHQNRSPFRAG